MRISDLCGGQPLYLRKERTTINGIGGWNLGQQSHVGSGEMLKKSSMGFSDGKSRNKSSELIAGYGK
jgi:hypothetical protein